MTCVIINMESGPTDISASGSNALGKARLGIALAFIRSRCTFRPTIRG